MADTTRNHFSISDNVGSIAVLERIGLKFERMIRLQEQSPELKLFVG